MKSNHMMNNMLQNIVKINHRQNFMGLIKKNHCLVLMRIYKNMIPLIKTLNSCSY